MQTLFRDYWLIWRYSTGIVPSLRVWLIILSLALLGIFLCWKSTITTRNILATIAIPVLLMGYVVWSTILEKTGRLNTAAVARLVPKMARRTAELNFFAWLAITTLGSLIYSAQNGYGHAAWGWAFWYYGAVLAGLGLPRRAGKWIPWIAVYGSALLTSLVKEYLPTQMIGDTVLLIYLPTLIWFVGHALQRMFQQIYIAPESEQRTVWPQKILAIIDRPLDLAVPRKPNHRNPESLLLNLFSIHRWHGIRTLSYKPDYALGALFLIYCGYLKLTTPDYFTPEALPLVLGVTAMFTLFTLLERNFWRERLMQTTGEQSLFRLSPAAPAMADLNRQLARTILKQSMFDWVLSTSMIMLGTTLFSLNPAILIFQLSLCTMSLPLVASSLRNYAVAPNQQPHNPLDWFGFALFGLALGWCIWYFAFQFVSQPLVWHASHVLPWSLGFAAINIALTVLFIRWRWHTMIHAPIVFPAGRLVSSLTNKEDR